MNNIEAGSFWLSAQFICQHSTLSTLENWYQSNHSSYACYFNDFIRNERLREEYYAVSRIFFFFFHESQFSAEGIIFYIVLETSWRGLSLSFSNTCICIYMYNVRRPFLLCVRWHYSKDGTNFRARVIARWRSPKLRNFLLSLSLESLFSIIWQLRMTSTKVGRFLFFHFPLLDFWQSTFS